MEQVNGCWNCKLSHPMCGGILCQWREEYVSPTGKCVWWVKKTKEQEENN